MEKVAVTGCAGYIGSILCQRLREEGYYVIGLERDCFNKPDNVDDVFHSLPMFTAAISAYKVNTVYHLAAKSVPIDESLKFPLRYYVSNPGLTADLLNRLQELKWEGNIVFASSASVYDDYELMKPVSEDGPVCPSSHYGLSKLMCEQILNSATVNNIWTVAFRFFNVAGGYKHLSDKNQHVITKLCEAATKQTPFSSSLPPFILNGIDYGTRDGTCVRDYVHVIDVCNAMIAAARNMEMTRNVNGHTWQQFRAYNLGTKKGVSLRELVKAFSIRTKKEITVIEGPRRVGDAPYLVADPSKFIREFDFVYKHSTLDNIITSAWERYNAV
jgi:UDP-glucose 4-epimerase